MSKKKTQEEYIAEVAKVNQNIDVIGLYINAQTKIKHKCKICGHKWMARPDNVLHGTGCPQCSGNIKRTVKEYIELLKIQNPDIELIGEYVNMTIPILHHCKKHNVYWNAVPYDILKGCGCVECGKEKIGDANRNIHEEYVKMVSKINSNIEVIGIYVDSKTHILHRCLIDGNEWMARPYNILSGRGCPICANKKIGDLFRKNAELYKQKLVEINSNIESLEEYIDSETPILHRCKMDGCVWKISPHNVLRGVGCPKCMGYKGEKNIAKFLEQHNILYIPQKRFNSCKDNKSLPFDFYLPQYNTCIEYDGRQHYEPVDFAGKGAEWAIDQLHIIQHHDSIKTQYCQDNNIKLLRIPYFKNIEEELNNFLFI